MNIVLIGFMGSGKTTVAKRLGEKFGFQVLDTDDLVEKKAKMSTSEIFDRFGEHRYRELEVEVAKDLSKVSNRIIATGGGVILNKIILDYLVCRGGKIVFLETTFEEIVKRIKNHSRNRPLFKDLNIAAELFKFRQPIYRKYSDFIITTDLKDTDSVVTEILEKINNEN